MTTSSEYILNLGLQPHPEGGYFRETYRSSENISLKGLPERFSGYRSFSTAIYYLLEEGSFSVFHKIKSDECWHFYAGDSLLIHMIQLNGKYDIIRLGKNLSEDEQFQFVVPANTWFAAEPAPGSLFSLAGCTVAPGFDFNDFDIAKKKDLLDSFPDQRPVIDRLCR